ncbi:MAG TPA: TMEM175 family protein [Candidatus Binatus sp.]|nr:TMEM175 family protein [Candidatus Binatus sp.]
MSSIPKIKVRIESLSDLVFGLALSFGSLILIGSQPKNGLDLLVNIFIFGFSFMIVVMTWIGYTRTITVLPAEASYALVLNLGLLFCVALEPYLFYLLITTQLVGVAEPASIAYAVDAGLMFLFLAGLARLVVMSQQKIRDSQLHPLVLKRFNRLMKIQAIIGGIYVISALPIFWINTPFGYLRFYLWFSPFLIVPAYRR